MEHLKDILQMGVFDIESVGFHRLEQRLDLPTFPII